jgi:hypothetical protein
MLSDRVMRNLQDSNIHKNGLVVSWETSKDAFNEV